MLTDTDHRILEGIARDTTRLIERAHFLRNNWTARCQAGRELVAAEWAKEGRGVRIDLVGWLGSDSAAIRKAGQRALAKLEIAGLVERSAGYGEKLTHANLTANGVAELAAPTAAEA